MDQLEDVSEKRDDHRERFCSGGKTRLVRRVEILEMGVVGQ